jgi:hypothetical protein
MTGFGGVSCWVHWEDLDLEGPTNWDLARGMKVSRVPDS